MELGKDAVITIAITHAAGVAGTTDINGATLDMQGFEAVLTIINFGVITAAAVTSIKMQQDSASGFGGADDLAGTGITVDATTGDEDTFYIDLIKPTKRYVRLVVDRATQNAVVGGATYIQYRARRSPVSHGASVTGETHVSPDEGTA